MAALSGIADERRERAGTGAALRRSSRSTTRAFDKVECPLVGAAKVVERVRGLRAVAVGMFSSPCSFVTSAVDVCGVAMNASAVALATFKTLPSPCARW
jgi:hypothetical protein